ncbi:uncharacterized protein METZ01_LOCUS342230, partial [marine metagenome]
WHLTGNPRSRPFSPRLARSPWRMIFYPTRSAA